MPVGEVGLLVYQSPVRARDIARPASARAHGAGSRAHRLDYFRVLAHTEIIVRAPDHHIPLAARAVPERMRKLSHLALQINKDAIAPLVFQSSDGGLKSPVIIEHCGHSFAGTQLCGGGRHGRAPPAGEAWANYSAATVCRAKLMPSAFATPVP